MVHHTPQQYLTAFRAQAACCQALAELSQAQQTCLAAADYAGLIELLGRKQQLIDQLAYTGQAGAALWQDWTVDRQSFTASDRAACELVLDETSELLRQLLSVEASAARQMESLHEETRAALAEVNLGGFAAQGYQSPDESTVSRRLDLDL